MPASNLRVTVLGPVLVEGRTGRLVEPGGRLATALVTILVLADGRAVSTAALIDELWDDAPPTGAKAALQTLVSRVRAVSAPGLIESSAAGYRLALGPEETDLGAAATMSDAATSAVRSGDAGLAGALAQQALDLWAGDPGAALDDRIADELGRRAERLRDELRRVRAQSRIELGEGAAVIADLEALSAADPLDDATHLMLFNAYAQSGRRADAMGLFADYRARLRDRLGADPASALVAAHTSLLQEDTAGGHATSTVPSPERSGRLVSGLRTAPNELIGRDADIEAIRSLIGSTRMTTILGPGGLGKTRVAQEIARQATASTPGVVFVELASIRDAADLPLAVATALGIREAPSARRLSEALTAHPVELHDRIIAALAERPTLLVMDNCEHLVDAAARWIADALDWTRELRILATSRSPLSIAAEHVYRLDPLPAGDATLLEDAGPAVRLFVERARAARPDAHIPLAVAARLCARLDGLPLAIELAAARTRSMSVDEVERRLGNRFALLTAGDRSAPERHQTLLAVIDWSWNLLGERERIVLRRTSRFPDGFGIDAATAVADEIDDVPEALDALVGQSLLTVRDDPATGTLRFRMLETVREFGMLALDEAGEGGRVLESTRAWAIGLAGAQLPSMHGPEQLSAFATLALEQDTLVGVLRGGIADERHDVVASVFAGLAVFWTIRSAHQEVLVFGEAVLDVLRRQDPRTVTDDATAVSCAVIAVTFLSTDFRTSARAIGALRRVERERVTQHPRMRALVELMLSAGREERALELMQEYRNAPDPQVANVGNLLAAQMAENSGDPRSAEAAALRANELSHAIGDVWGAAMSAHMLAQLHSQNAEPTEALRWASDAASGLRAVGADADLRQLDWLVALGDVARGEFTAATDVLERFLGDDVADSAFAPIPERRSIVWAGLAEVARAQGDLRRGAELYDLALGSFAAAESRRSPWFALVTAAALAAAVLDDTHEDAWLGRIARRLRTRTVALGRLLPNRFDRPVLGSGVLALGSWYARSEDPAVRSAGVELVALAARLASRQDIPSLVRAQHERAVTDRSTAPDLERQAAEVAPLTVDESAARALELLSSKALAAR
ncbi:BTAD domain-containing putative transcriptional regulator [Plantibacter sp. ME-Dv--P-122b]|uniref:BTAD domain-containing putative transcriptional regulator n=1 Tax=Plantibacter sp. ME-Dv--P-122b TaxID=3040300 RepID=UPI00254C1CEA|nr:BTAD domain-containing putative transcriptional regulator [Plantibacter sp. ME-Dv--P-122b]